eukprot:NODE_313_length_11219_cov_0.287770.p6 type:complete len:124 gc:universal NODE_313_length_11219_cov_0.287770:5361-4990(-)
MTMRRIESRVEMYFTGLLNVNDAIANKSKIYYLASIDFAYCLKYFGGFLNSLEWNCTEIFASGLLVSLIVLSSLSSSSTSPSSTCICASSNVHKSSSIKYICSLGNSNNSCNGLTNESHAKTL